MRRLLLALLLFAAPAHAASVKDFGAVGDGVKNDTAAVQAAIDEAGQTGGGMVTLPSGIYLVNPLALRTGVALVGDGIGATVIRLTGSSIQHNDAIHLIGVERVTMRALTLDVDGLHQLTQGSEGTRGIQIDASAIVTIESVEVVNSGGAGIKVSSGADIKILNSSVSLAGQNPSGTPAPGIDLGATDALLRDVLVTGNRISRATQEGISIRAGGVSGSTRGIVISSNVLTDNNQRNWTKGAITVTLQSENVTVTGNVIRLDPRAASSLGISVQPMLSGIMITGNMIEMTSPGHIGVAALDIAGGKSRGVLISGNVFRGPGRAIVVSPSTPVSLMGNDLTAVTNATPAVFMPPTAAGLYIGINPGL